MMGSERKYKVGDRVRVVDAEGGGKVGDVGVITSIDPYYNSGDGQYYSISGLSSGTIGLFGYRLEPAPLFAVGDKVRHAQLTETGEGTVENIYGGDTFGVRWSSWHGFCTEPASALEHLPEPAPVAASNDNATPAKFKVGDRVTQPGWEDTDSCTVTALDDIYIHVVSDDGRRGTYSHDAPFRLTPLTIQAGRYYKTRDGRKVGPAELMAGGIHRWWVGGESYTSAGEWLRGEQGDDDLIAEWPASNTDILDELEDWMADNPIDGDLDATPVDATLTTKITVDFTDFDAELDRIFARLRKLRRKTKKLGIKVDSSGLQDAA